MRISGVNELYIFKMSSSNPLKTDKIIIKAALPTNTPSVLMPDIMFIALTDFFENKYLLAINKGVFIVLILSSYIRVIDFFFANSRRRAVPGIYHRFFRKHIEPLANAG